MRSGRRPSPEGTRLLFAGTISPMMYLSGGPTEGRYDTTRRKARKKKKKIEQQHRARKTKEAFPRLAGGARTTQETRGKAEIEGQK